MFNITKKDKRTNLEKEIDAVLDEMSKRSSASEEYSTMSQNLERLYKAKSCEKSRKVSPDTMVIVAGSLLGTLLILGYEKTGVITSKAFNYIIRGRV